MGDRALSAQMSNLELPPQWQEVIRRIRLAAPSAVIAGGALRDLDNGREVKDIDVFYTDDLERPLVLDYVLEGLFVYHSRCAGIYMDDAADEVDGTATYISINGDLPDLNLIQLRKDFNPARVIDRCDFGLCQIGYDLRGVVKTPQYEYDKANQCFTLTRAESIEGVRRSLKRFERLQRKYVGWKLVVPEEFMRIYQAALEVEEVNQQLDQVLGDLNVWNVDRPAC